MVSARHARKVQSTGNLERRDAFCSSFGVSVYRTCFIRVSFLFNQANNNKQQSDMQL